MLIRISGPASVVRKGAPVTDHDVIAAIAAARSDERCSDHLTNDLADVGVTGGTVTLAYYAEPDRFRVVTEYFAPAPLNEAEVSSLIEQTRGQWSDGIGEHCFDDLCREYGLDIDLCSQAKDVRVEQIDDGVSGRRPPAALFQAVRAGDVKAMCKLLDSGADLEARSRGSTLLLMAVSSGNAEAALDLLRRGADPMAMSDSGIDALMWTASSNRMPDADAAVVARALLIRRTVASISSVVDVNAPRGRHTPLYMARNRKKAALIDVLVEFGASDADAQPGPAA